MPAVEVGSIIEYRWKEVRPGALAALLSYLRLQFQRDIPVQFVKYYLKPTSLGAGYTSIGMASKTFNGNAQFVQEKNGFYSTTMTNVPAFHEEPRMPPEDQVRTWMLVFYQLERNKKPDEYWSQLGKEQFEKVKPRLKVNDDIKKASVAAIGDASTPEQKLERLFDFVRAKIKNVDSEASGITASERAKLRENNSPGDTLKRGTGTGENINALFAALAIAAGFDVRPAYLGDRSDFFFDPNFTDPYFRSGDDVAVKVGNDWKFFDPASTYIPFGMLRWQEEAMKALIIDPKGGFFVDVPLSPAEKSKERRNGKFKLTEDGTLEGDVRIEYTGHLAAEKKQQNDDDSPTQREQNLKDMVTHRLSTAELSEIKIENVTDPAKPFVYSFHVRVPGYAQKTGKRLFVQPGFFEHGRNAVFSSNERKYQVYFHYPWLEEDTLTIDLPRGYELDHPEQPAPLRSGDVVDYDVKISVVNKSEQLMYHRKFKFQGLLFPTATYSTLKQVFDLVHESDNHTITLKQTITAKTDQ